MKNILTNNYEIKISTYLNVNKNKSVISKHVQTGHKSVLPPYALNILS